MSITVLRAASLCACLLFWLASVPADVDGQSRPFEQFERWQARRPELREAPFASWRPRRAPVLSLSRGCANRMTLRADFVRRIRRRRLRAPQLMEIEPTYGTVHFRKRRDDAPFIVACALAERMPDLARVFARHGVREVVVNSAWRREPVVSYHSMGLALDIKALVMRDGTEVPVLGHYPTDAAHPTCHRRTGLAALACDLASDPRLGLSTVLTPNYPGHEDHFHIDLRPGDPLVFVR